MIPLWVSLPVPINKELRVTLKDESKVEKPKEEAPAPEKVAATWKGISVNRHVAYVPQTWDTQSPGEEWAAIVVAVERQMTAEGLSEPDGKLTLVVFPPKRPMVGDFPVQQRLEVPFSDASVPHSWHWPPRA